MNKIINIINSIQDSELKKAVMEGYSSIIENYWKPAPIMPSSEIYGSFDSLTHHVSGQTTGGNGLQIDRSIDHHVNASPASTRDPKEETTTQWKDQQMQPPPIKSRAPKFVGKAIETAQNHIPTRGEVDIPTSERRFTAIYPTLNPGVCGSMAKLKN